MRAELQRIGREYNEWDRVAEIYLSAVDEFGPIENAVALHHEVARFRDELGQIDKSEELYNAILSLKSDDVTALDRIEQIYRSQERWGDLSNLLERRTSGPTEALPHGPERRAKFRELAELYELRLEKPYEAIDTLERFVAETAAEDDRAAHADVAADEDDRADAVHERIGAYEALVRLYSRVGLWAKVVESLQHQADLTRDRGKARDLRLRIATVYEKELGQAERAVDAYEALLAQIPDDPEALAALDRLHEAHGHFDDLQVILGRRAAAASGDERREIVRRRARILEEKLGNPEAAASALRELGDEAIADDELMSALIRNLRRAGLAHEAARVLTQKIEMERAAGNDERTRTARRRSQPRAVAAQARRSQRRQGRARRGRGGAGRFAQQPGGAGGDGAALPQGERLLGLRRDARPRGQGAGRKAGGGRGAARRRPRVPRADRRAREGADLLRGGAERGPAQRRCAALAVGAAGVPGGVGRGQDGAAAPAGDLGDPGDARRRAHRPRARRLGGLGRRGGGAALPRRGAGPGPRSHARGHRDRRHLLQGKPLGAGREAPDRGGAQAARPAPADGAALPAPRRGAREARQAGRGLPPAAGGRSHGTGAAGHQALAGREPLPRRQVARGGAAPGRARRSPRRRDLSRRGRRRAGARRAVRDQAAPARAGDRALRGGAAPAQRSRPVAARAGRPGAGARREAAGGDLPAPHGRDVERSRGARRPAGAGRRSLPRARRRDAGAGRLRGGAEDHRRPVGGSRAAAREGAQAAARGRPRRGGGAHVVAAHRSRQGSQGARGAAARRGAAAGQARRHRRGGAPAATGARRAAAGRGRARGSVRRLAGAGQGGRAREAAAQDAAGTAGHRDQRR